MKKEILKILEDTIEENENYINNHLKKLKHDVENVWLGSIKANVDQVKICNARIELIRELEERIKEL